MIAGRSIFGLGLDLLVSLVFGGCWALLSVADLLDRDLLPSSKPLAYSVRLASTSVDTDPETEHVGLKLERKLFARGQTLRPDQLREVKAHESFAAPPMLDSLVVAGLFRALLILFFCSFLRSTGFGVSILRAQLVILSTITALLLMAKALLMLTAFSAMWIPLVGTTILFGYCMGRSVAYAVAILGSIALSVLIPFDLPLLLVMLAQGLTAGAVVRQPHRQSSFATGTISSATAGAITYLGLQLFFERPAPASELVQGTMDLGALLGSGLAGSAGSAVAGGLIAVILLPVARQFLGFVTKAQLTALADFEHPLLQRLAKEAPGTWAHSTNMANMAQMAANKIGADGQLLRVGAYYHDVGKCLFGGCFIENQQGENPHDSLAPDISSEAIRSHVTDGVKLARKNNIPEAVVSFIYTHHGNERLEYFWHKAQSSESLHNLAEKDFRYTGAPPQTKEQGILSICDAVEAASHTLRNPDATKIEQLVRQIVFNKLRGGVLDSCGLTVRELRLITESFIDSLQSSLHVRVEYPWQQRQRAASGESDQVTHPPQKKKV